MNRIIRTASLFLSLFFILTAIPVFAAETASGQINSYYIDVYESDDGQIAVELDVIGSGTMDHIGAESIAVYYKDGTRWIFFDEKTRDNSGMSRSNEKTFTNTIYYDVDSGCDYKVVVEIFAENDEGYDSRIKTCYISL